MKNNKLNERSNKNHDREHAHWDRRGFLKTLGIAGAGSISFAGSSLSVVNSHFLTNALSEADSELGRLLNPALAGGWCLAWLPKRASKNTPPRNQNS